MGAAFQHSPSLLRFRGLGFTISDPPSLSQEAAAFDDAVDLAAANPTLGLNKVSFCVLGRFFWGFSGST